MGIDIVPGQFCASYFATYKVEGSKGNEYTVTLSGGEGPAYCDCPAFKFHKGPEYDRTCKHLEYVWNHACMWNCQWHDGNNEVTLRPEFVDTNVIPESECPNCGGPLVPVRIAV